VAEQIVFAVAAAAALVCGGLVITIRNPFRAAVALIGCLASVAVIFVLLAAPFAAAVQLIVYAGAIVVLFLFVIAYLGERGVLGAPDRLAPYRVFAAVAALALLFEGTIVLLGTRLPGARSAQAPPGDIGSPRAIGESFLSDHLVPFEATSLLLLAAAIGAVLLAKRAIQLEGGR
jgi:NADH:ubiquinone oxidoreductase subunit 6 (subunit J)